MTAHLIFGCGYLGRRVADRWLAAGHTVYAVTRSEPRAAEFAASGMEPLIGDICDSHRFPALPDEIDTVLFSVGFDRTPGQSQTDVFVDGLRRVVTAIGSRCRRFVYISSTSVYGQSDGGWVDELSPCEPSQPGGIACLAAEQILRERFPTGDSRIHAAIALRLGGIYGPGRLLTRTAELQSGQPLSGWPDAWLNLIHVEDAANIVAAVAQHDSPPQTLVVTDDQPVQRLAYYSKLAELTGLPTPTFDAAQERKRGSGGLNKRCSNRRMRGMLPLELQFPTFESGLKDAMKGD